ncbi:4-hydroxy-tetrahydrodipicolinate reductase [Thalassospira sp.]|uniref:4-hydroxy-tetrahydrodipicolinate reductase n=1 Tax=Thalassospira sp. TaxID=1912094 RepID=UPI002733A1E2|nr:4-hydroxy-tetrahydrodipicolinate reductase [Thalassospira sp.]MDP2699172.1 4-hydroxy-tetrahydrodipicolinate reductase [Thalassospira sp.]
MKVGIVGCAGRMGRMLVAETAKTEGCEIGGGTDLPGSPFVGKDIALLAGLEECGITVISDPVELFATVDAVIDFTAPAATMKHAAIAARAGKILVIGTTGLSTDQKAELAEFAEKTTIVFAPNMSVGVNLAFALVEKVAAILDKDTADIEIVEMHHKHKVDAPSGTALGLGEAAARGRGVDLETVSVRSRDGFTGARENGSIGFATLRGGDVIGEHTVVFACEGERIEITHKASSREVFAKGAVRAAKWAEGKGPGLYAMRDVLGL